MFDYKSSQDKDNNTVLYLQEKQNYIPEELGRDAQSVAALQRKHANFENDLNTLGTQVSLIYIVYLIIYSLLYVLMI